MERKSSLEQLAPLSGIAFAVLGVAGMAMVLPGSPDFVGPGDEYVRYYTQHDNDIIIGCIGLLLATFALAWFLGSVRRHLAQAEGGDGRLANVAFAGGAIGAAMLLGSTAARVGPALRVDDQGTIARDVAVTLGDLADILWGLAAPLGLGVLVAATAVVGLRYAGGGVPRWLAWTSVPLAVLLVVPVISWLAIMVFPLWAVAMSVVIYRQEVGVPQRAPAREASPAAVAT
jgi:hypothetical protein